MTSSIGMMTFPSVSNKKWMFQTTNQTSSLVTQIPTATNCSSAGKLSAATTVCRVKATNF